MAGTGNVPDTPVIPDVPDTPDVPDAPDPADDANVPVDGILLSQKTYYDTGRKRTPRTRVCLECDTSDMVNRYYCAFFGEQGNYGNRFVLRLQNGSLYAYDMQPHTIKGYIVGKNKFAGDVASKTWMINNAAAQAFYTKDIAMDGVGTMFLGAMRDMDGLVTNVCNGLVIHRFRIWESDTLVMCLIPAKDADGKPCLKDTVSGSFLYHLGSGDVYYV